jgi:hypothetical protein
MHESGSKVKFERLWQFAKHESAIVSTDAGRQKLRSDKQEENAPLPRIDTLVPDSNVTCERFVQQLKQELKTVSIDEGIRID